MKNRLFSVVCSLSLLLPLLPPEAVLAQTVKDTAAPKTGAPVAHSLLDRPITLEVRNATASDLVAALGQKYGLNLVADAYADEVRAPLVSLKDVPLRQAAANVAAMLGREAIVLNNVIVLRHEKWFLRAWEERLRADKYGNPWKEEGSVSVKRLDEATAASNTAPAAVGPRSQEAAVGSSAPKRLPARIVAVKAMNAPMSRVTETFTTETGWKVNLDPSLGRRRVSAHLSNVTPGQALEAFTRLLEAGQQVTIGRTREQQEREAALVAEAQDRRLPREKQSDALRADLERLLTPEQRAALEAGQEVPLSLSSLPTNLRERAMNYIRASWADIAGRLQGDAALDLSRINEFSVVFLPRPNAPTGTLGVDGFGTDGMGHHF